MRTRSSQDDAVETNEPPIELQAVSEEVVDGATELRDEDTPSSNVAEAYPEGGYGWVVVASCFTLAFFFVGVSYSFGLLEARLVADNVASATTVSFVGSLGMASISIFGTLATLLNRRFGSRLVLTYGTAFFGGGLALSGFTAHKIAGLFITQSLVSGLGASLFLVTVTSLPSQYFLRRRGLATGIILSAGGVGGAVLSLLLGVLLERVGTQWTYHIVGLMACAICFPACLLIRERIPRRSAPIWDTRLLLDLRVFTIFISGALAVFPLLVPPYFLPLYGTASGLSNTSSAGLVAGFNLASAVGRVGFGFLADKIGAVNALIISEAANALSLLVIWPFGESKVALGVFVTVSGLSVGAFFSLMPTVTASVVEPAQIPTALSMVVTSWAGGYLFGSPIAAAIIEAYGGTHAGLTPYLPAMFYAGGITALCAAMLMGMKWKHAGMLWARM